MQSEGRMEREKKGQKTLQRIWDFKKVAKNKQMTNCVDEWSVCHKIQLTIEENLFKMPQLLWNVVLLRTTGENL